MNYKVGFAVLACALAVPAYADDCNHSTHRTANSAGPDITRVVVEAGAGDLVVRGGDSRDVKVEGKACASTAELLEDIKLEIRREATRFTCAPYCPTSPLACSASIAMHTST